MRLTRYNVADGCVISDIDEKPQWGEYGDAEKQLKDVVETVNGRLGGAVKEAWFTTDKPTVHIGLLFGDSTMVAGMLRNGALEREVTPVTARFGYRVDSVETNIGSSNDKPTVTLVLAKIDAG